jgi:hypothetical protein
MFKGRTTKPTTKPITGRALRSRNNNKRPRDNDDFEMGVSDMNDDDTYYEDDMSDDEIKFLGSML